ncbi:uncharacterized protein N7515_009316 [Penicillium bovifimosum]|uniref:Uncharacterized protein n=1 Tax=Penicillium bovifimosum TaxID=126998 RepID=A0A9W9KVW7_9EURO|nr:uncharacterized protein N7515_009316 [Penicillium bovifimosum]KAJ5121355.1 hypothetical protein N7515_009316 [Penicillium bovifimosum]
MRRVYQEVVVPQMLYGVAVWLCLKARTMPMENDPKSHRVHRNLATRRPINIWRIQVDQHTRTQNGAVPSIHRAPSVANDRGNSYPNPGKISLGSARAPMLVTPAHDQRDQG